MSTSKAIDRICIIAVVVALLISLLFMNGASFGILTKANAMAETQEWLNSQYCFHSTNLSGLAWHFYWVKSATVSWKEAGE